MRTIVLTLTIAAVAACSGDTSTSQTAPDLTGGSRTDHGTTPPTTSLPTTSDSGPDTTAVVSESTDNIFMMKPCCLLSKQLGE